MMQYSGKRRCFIMNNQAPTNPDSFDEVSDPTWHDHIKYFFRQADKDCMGPKGVDLESYQAVRDKSSSIYSRVRRRSGPRRMPTDLAWATERVETFKNWVNNDFKVGGESLNRGLPVPSADDNRVRKSLHELSSQEKADITKAFQGIMDLDPDNDNSYWSITSAHGLPAPYDCVHGSEQFNHWHRLYMLQMENALRLVPGCEHVTLPYWDLTQDSVPDLLNQSLFKSYTWPTSKGIYSTSRRRNSDIIRSIKDFGIRSNIETAMLEPWYEDFWMELEDNSHDPGHGSIGGSNRNSSYASFDPIFWFFHCYWDKLVWDWQLFQNATTLDSFKDKMRDFKDWLDDDLKIGTVRAKSINLIDNTKIDLSSIGLGSGTVGILYQQIQPGVLDPLLERSLLKSKSISGAAKFSIPKEQMASIMLKGVHRLNIDGSFYINLYAGRKIIARSYEFQFLDPTKCPNCVKDPIKNYKMRVPVRQLENGKLKVVLKSAEDNSPIDMIDVGSPTLNVRLLLE